jgi:hypothetical protein
MKKLKYSVQKTNNWRHRNSASIYMKNGSFQRSNIESFNQGILKPLKLKQEQASEQRYTIFASSSNIPI